MYFPNRETCPACGKVAHGVHECNQVHIVDHQRARGGRDERARIVAIIDARLMAIEPNDADASDEALTIPVGLSLDEATRRYVEATLAASDGNKTEAAKRLGVGRTEPFALRAAPGACPCPWCRPVLSAASRTGGPGVSACP